jgi:hypothetical protein
VHREEHGRMSFGRSKILHVDLPDSLGIFRSTCLTITVQKWVAMANVNKAILNMRIED